MPIVFVHGVPETWRVWDGIIGESGRDDVVALALPGVREDRDGLGERAFRVGRKGFVQTWRGRVVMKLDRWRQELLFEARPDVFSPMNAGRLRWAWVETDTLDIDEIADLVTEAWRQVAPKKVSRTSLPPHGGSGPKGRWGSPPEPMPLIAELAPNTDAGAEGERRRRR